MKIKDHMPFAYAYRLAQGIAQYLKRRYGATRVMIFGSLAVGCYNPDFSDIDVYFEGVREELVADAMADCTLNFGLRDSSGRQRIDYFTAERIPEMVKPYLMRDAAEI